MEYSCTQVNCEDLNVFNRISCLKLINLNSTPVVSGIATLQVFRRYVLPLYTVACYNLFFFPLQISIYAPYWMINSTGIPLIFKQEAVPHDMAGQFDEHEMARSLTPLLFSFSDTDAPTRYVLYQ